MHKTFVLLVLMLFIVSSGFTQNPIVSNKDIERSVRSTDVERKSFQDTAVINLYQGNGVFGSSYGPLGLHINPSRNEELTKYGKTEYLHMNHVIRGKFAADYLIPLGQIFWENEPTKVSNYSQHQSFYDGTINTHFESGKNKISVLSWYDPVDKNLAGIKINLDGSISDVIFKPSVLLKVHYGQEVVQTSIVTEKEGEWKIELSCLNAKSCVYIKTNADVKTQGSNLVFKLRSGENDIQISVNEPVNCSPKKSLTQTMEWWNSKWLEMGFIIIPDLNAQQVWVRSMAQFLYSYNDDKLGLSPAMGFTGNHWPFGFPQDVSYIHPILLSTGNLSIAKSWIEYFAERLTGMQEYTKRLLKVDGVMCPWVFPYGDFTGYHTPDAPNKFYYEIHNSGYLARMAFETAVFVNDESWTQKYAVPLVRETAKFYKSISQKGTDNLWHISIKPSVGQDERGGVDQDDYLCALFSAKYCFQKAIEYQLDEDGTYAQILKDGLAFNSLLSGSGYYYTSKGRGEADYGKQKHPVQLNDLAFLPVNSEVNNPSAIVYNQRYDITQDAQKPYFYGWSLGEFLLAGSRIGNVEEWKKDWQNLRKADYVDPDWIQVYETSGVYQDSFYGITNGLITQSLLNNLVSDWFGKLEIAKCNPWKGKISLKNIYSKLGVKIGGEINGDNASLILTGWKDCEFEMQGEKIALKKNETIRKNLRLKSSVSSSGQESMHKLPGKGLSQFDFFYAGESKEQNMYIVKNGRIEWEYKGPKDQGEISDAVLMTNGNILFAHQRGITLITPEKKVLWHYDAPKGCEIHTAQPIGKKYVMFIQNGDSGRVFVVNVKKNETVRRFTIPIKMPASTHGQFRHARLTVKGTLMVAHMDLGKISEYDSRGKELFTMSAPGVWGVEPLKNGNILACCRSQILEVTSKGEKVWDFQFKDIPEYNFNSPQVAIRRPNGNTVAGNWFNQWSGTGKVDPSNQPIQAIEITPDKKVVWALQSWTSPVDLGPSTIIQILGDNGISEYVTFGEFK